MLGNGIRKFTNVRTSNGNDLLHFRIVIAIDQGAGLLYAANKVLELLHVTFKSREHVDVIPCDSAEQSDIRFIQKEFRSSVNGRSQIFISFKYCNGCSMRELHHRIK